VPRFLYDCLVLYGNSIIRVCEVAWALFSNMVIVQELSCASLRFLCSAFKITNLMCFQKKEKSCHMFK
jgi:hypothetical protein